MAEVSDATAKDQLMILVNSSGRSLTKSRASQVVREWRERGLSETLD